MITRREDHIKWINGLTRLSRSIASIFRFSIECNEAMRDASHLARSENPFVLSSVGRWRTTFPKLYSPLAVCEISPLITSPRMHLFLYPSTIKVIQVISLFKSEAVTPVQKL